MNKFEKAHVVGVCLFTVASPFGEGNSIVGTGHMGTPACKQTD